LDERVGKRKSDSSQHLRLEKGVEGRCQGWEDGGEELRWEERY
jgi:hypothetical protein